MTKRRTIPALMAVLIVVVIALAALNLSDIGKQKTWDVEIPMANAQVSWLQTYYGGHD